MKRALLTRFRGPRGAMCLALAALAAAAQPAAAEETPVAARDTVCKFELRATVQLPLKYAIRATRLDPVGSATCMDSFIYVASGGMGVEPSPHVREGVPVASILYFGTDPRDCYYLRWSGRLTVELPDPIAVYLAEGNTFGGLVGGGRWTVAEVDRFGRPYTLTTPPVPVAYRFSDDEEIDTASPSVLPCDGPDRTATIVVEGTLSAFEP